MCSGTADADSQEPQRDLVVATAFSDLPETAAAVRQIWSRLGCERAGQPSFVTLHHGSARPVAALWEQARLAFDRNAMHGASSCQGVMTEAGVFQDNGDSIGAFAIWDPAGAYGTAMVPFGDAPREAGRQAVRLALARAGRHGEVPDLVWLSAVPGHEEQVLEGITDILGSDALIVGGSAADNDVAGGWSVFAHEGVSAEAAVVSVLFPSTPFGRAFESGYAPMPQRGTVTAAQGRRLVSIDHRPAAEVYAEWTGGRFTVPTSGRKPILSEATMAPLGRLYTDINGIGFHLLAHPAAVCDDGSLELFADVRVGDDLCLMSGSEESQVDRAGRIAARSRGQLGDCAPAGALVVYCGGCMLAIRGRMGDVAARVAENLGGRPFLGVFSFGEQGEMLDGVSAHGNLMISCTTFGAVRNGLSAVRGIGGPS